MIGFNIDANIKAIMNGKSTGKRYRAVTKSIATTAPTNANPRRKRLYFSARRLSILAHPLLSFTIYYNMVILKSILS